MMMAAIGGREISRSGNSLVMKRTTSTSWMALRCFFSLALCALCVDGELSWSESSWNKSQATERVHMHALAKSLIQDLKGGCDYFDRNHLTGNYSVRMEDRYMYWRCEEPWKKCAAPAGSTDVLQRVKKIVIRGQDEERGPQWQVLGDFVDTDGSPIYRIPDVSEDMDSSPRKVEQWFHRWYVRGSHVRFHDFSAKSSDSPFSDVSAHFTNNHDLLFNADGSLSHWERRRERRDYAEPFHS